MEALIPISLFGIIALIVWIVTHNRVKAHKESLAIIDKMVDRGDAVNEETVKALGGRPMSPHRDLKTGMILIAIAVALVIFGNVVPDEDDAPRVLTGIASFPFLVGFVYIAFWYMFDRKKT